MHANRKVSKEFILLWELFIHGSWVYRDFQEGVWGFLEGYLIMEIIILKTLATISSRGKEQKRKESARVNRLAARAAYPWFCTWVIEPAGEESRTLIIQNNSAIPRASNPNKIIYYRLMHSGPSYHLWLGLSLIWFGIFECPNFLENRSWLWGYPFQNQP